MIPFPLRLGKFMCQKYIENPVHFLQLLSSCCVAQNVAQRAGIADGGGFYIRPPGTAAWLFDKVKY
jgi:hypothetical protein